MSSRSQWTDFDKETRKYIKKRDKDECVICHKKGALQIMHIFLNRSHGGKGCKENGCLGCVSCHAILDNAIGKEQNKLAREYMQICKNYLKEKENITDEKVLIESLKFKKPIISYEERIKEKAEHRCKECLWCASTKYPNKTIPTYFCKLRRTLVGKKNSVCSQYEGKQNDKR